MDFAQFLELESTDYKGRTLQDIWAFSDTQIEYTHDFIQLIFPLNKPSRNNFNGLYLTDDAVIKQIRASQIATGNLIQSSHWFLSFLSRNDQWKDRYNHNQLRITRMIESLRLLASDNHADQCREAIFSMVPDKGSINEKTLLFWENA